MIPFGTHIAAALVAGVLAFGAGWQVQAWRYGKQIAEMRLDTANEVTEALRRTSARIESITTTYQGALNAARIREALLRTELDRLHRVSDGLRDQNATAARLLAAAPPGAVLEYATALGAVFEDCRAAYGGMVEKADGHASDVRTLREAWPVTPPRPAAGTT